MLITFSGIDGAGKSTQIAHLQSRLEDAGLKVELLTFWDDAATLKRLREGVGRTLFKGDQGVGTPERPISRRDKNVSSPGLTLLRLVIYLADAVSLRKIASAAVKSRADVVIFDRYIYDELANLDLGKATGRAYLRGIMKLVPKPWISFFLDADPEQAWSRKREYPLEFVELNRRSYLQLSSLLGHITVVPPLPLDEAKAQVASYVTRLLPNYQETA